MTRPWLRAIAGGRQVLEEQALLTCFEGDDEAFASVLRRLKSAANAQVRVVVDNTLDRGNRSAPHREGFEYEPAR